MKGKRMPKLDKAALIAHAKGITIDQLYDIIRKYRPAKLADRDPKSGLNEVSKMKAAVRKSGGAVERSSKLKIDIETPMAPVTPKDKFEIYGG